MGRKVDEFDNVTGAELDTSTQLAETKVEIVNQRPARRESKTSETSDTEPLINCLRNERIIVRFRPKTTGLIQNPKHVLFGGMSENAVKTYTVPRLSSGIFVNVLTNSEKAFLEHIMGLEKDALSVYKKENNFWSDANPDGISSVRLRKQDNYLDLSVPEDYIKYKILLVNKDFIAPSLKALQDYPKATYQFVIVSENEETQMASDNMSTTMKCYKAFGKIEDDFDIMRTIVELMTGRPTAPKVKIEFLKSQINNLIQGDSKLFLRTVEDPLLPAKSLIKRAVEAGLIANRNGYYYLRSDNSPLCENNEDPTMNVAAIYINKPKNQDLKFNLEARVKEA